MLSDYLEKIQLDAKKKNKPWTKRWFVLEGNTLSYYDNQKAKNCKGSYSLGKGKITCDPENLEFELRTDNYARAFRTKTVQAFREWVTALYQIMVTGVFGKPITSLRDAPFLLDWYDHLTKYGLEVEGIFRVPGQHQAINELKSRYNRGDRIHLDAPDEVGTNSDGVHIVADLLKTWFRNLPIKLISAEVVEEIAAQEHEPEELRELFTKMLTSPDTTPPIFAAVLRQLFEFLHTIAQKSEINKMTASNLAVCFTPSLCYLPMSQIESADRILKKLAQCIANAIDHPDAWLPVTPAQMAAAGADAQRTGRVSPTAGVAAAGFSAAEDTSAAGGGGGGGAHKDASEGKSAEGKEADASPAAGGAAAGGETKPAHAREDSDLTKMVKSAKQVSLNASPLGPIADDEDSAASSTAGGKSGGGGGGGSAAAVPPQPSDDAAQARADAKIMRKKLRDAGWVSKKARDGRTFFFHRKERRSSWSADGLVACWIRVKSSTTGKPYYYHSITKESKWRLGKGDLTFDHIFGGDDDNEKAGK